MSKHRITDAGPCCTALLAAPLDEQHAADFAHVFKALGDPVRLRLLSLIAARNGAEVCVCELTPAFELSQPTISHHLKQLRLAGLIAAERRGTWVYYRLLPAATDRLAALFARPADMADPSADPPVPASAPASAAPSAAVSADLRGGVIA